MSKLEETDEKVPKTSQNSINNSNTVNPPAKKYRKINTGDKQSEEKENNGKNNEERKRKYAHLLPPARRMPTIPPTGSSVLPVKTAPQPQRAGRGKKLQGRTPDLSVVPSILNNKIVSCRKTYHDLYSKLLSFEIQEEMKEVDDRLLNWPKHKLIRDGCTLFDMKGGGSGFINNELTLIFEPKETSNLANNKFVQGDIVVITEAGTSCTVRLEGLVSMISKTAIHISTRNVPDNFEEKLWRIDRGANQNAFTRMTEALKIFSSNRAETDDYLKDWARNSKIPACYLPSVGKQSAFKTIIIDNIKEAETHAAQPSILAPLHDPKKIEAIMSDWPLNNGQYSTIVDVLGRRLSLIQGPPGTGKTHTAIHLLLLLVKLYEDDNIPILATAYTNVATDNLLQGLRSHGVEALRLGRPVKVRDELRDATLQSHLERHPQRKLLDQLREELTLLKGDHYQDKLRDIKHLETTMTTEIVAKARVICTTCIGAGDPILADQYFPLVVIDESTQAIEPAILVPMTKGAQQVIFLGDHYQLPPTVKSSKAEQLKDSLFHRLVKEGNLKPFVLNSQYRMHPLISEFPSAHFYHGQIKDAISASKRPLPKGFPWKDNKPLILLHVNGKEINSEAGSRRNDIEASIVISIVRDFLNEQEITKSDIGIVTPYAGQVNHITLLLNKDPLFTTATDRDVMDEGEDARTQLAGGLNVASVDGFQGREKEVIIFSSVRSNTTGSVGFLSDWRRLNVAITRARRGFIVIGNVNTLCNDSHWHAWLTWMGSKGLILDYEDWKTGKHTQLPVPAFNSNTATQTTNNTTPLNSNASPVAQNSASTTISQTPKTKTPPVKRITQTNVSSVQATSPQNKKIKTTPILNNSQPNIASTAISTTPTPINTIPLNNISPPNVASVLPVDTPVLVSPIIPQTPITDNTIPMNNISPSNNVPVTDPVIKPEIVSTTPQVPSQTELTLPLTQPIVPLNNSPLLPTPTEITDLPLSAPNAPNVQNIHNVPNAQDDKDTEMTAIEEPSPSNEDLPKINNLTPPVKAPVIPSAPGKHGGDNAELDAADLNADMIDLNGNTDLDCG